MRSLELPICYINASCRILPGQAWKDDQPYPVQIAGEGESFLQALYHSLALQYPKWYKMDRLCQLALLAAELLLQPPFSSGLFAPQEVAVVLVNRHSSLDTDAKFVEQLADIPSPATFVYTLPNIMIGEIGIRHGFKGEQACFLAATPDAVFLEEYVRALFREGGTKCCIVGWIDAYREQYEAGLVLVSDRQLNIATNKIFNRENLYQYLYHEQGAVN